MNTKILITAVALAAAAKVSAISYDANVNFTSAPSGASFTAVGGAGTVGLKYQDGGFALGVKSGATNAGNEIGPGEKLIINFNAPQIFDSLTFGLLFDGPEYNDVFEIAAALTDASSHVFTLKATGTTTAIWNGSSFATNIKPAKANKGGVWEVLNPFGNLAITSLTLYPINSAEYSAYTGAKSSSDFGLVGFVTHKAPDAASTLGLAGLALLGLGLASRRR